MKVLKPREKFLADPNSVSRWQRLVDDAFFVETTEKVFTDLAMNLGGPDDPIALQNHYRLQGARLYRERLLTFADSTEPARTPRSDRLDPSAETYIAPPRAKH